MDDQERADAFFDTLAKVLIRSFWMGIAVLLWWFVAFLLAADWMYAVHSKWFEITKHDFHIMSYYGMALLKMVIFVFFLLPYLSIRLVLRKKKGAV